MNSLYERFNVVVDVESLRKDILKGKKVDHFVAKDAPHGTYEVTIDRLYLRKSSNGNSMVTANFKILEGEYVDQMIFMNQVITNQFGLQKVNRLLYNMDVVETVMYQSDDQYEVLLSEIASTAKDTKSFTLSYLPQASDPNWSDFNILNSKDL